MNKSQIEWCSHTWNPYVGCTPYSPGCLHCWARRLENGRLRHLGRCDGDDADDPSRGYYFWNGPVFQGMEVLRKPLGWRKPRVVFVCSSSDLFHCAISDKGRDAVFAAMMLASPKMRFLVLTKRIGSALVYLERMQAERLTPVEDIAQAGADVLDRLPRDDNFWSWPPANIAIGCTVCTQEEATQKVYMLDHLGLGRWHTFLSLEPLLEPVRLTPSYLTQIGWVIVGCESGAKRRPCDPMWILDIVKQCRSAGVPCFVKQVSVGGRVSHDPAEWPEPLRVREVPEWARVEQSGDSGQLEGEK